MMMQMAAAANMRKAMQEEIAMQTSQISHQDAERESMRSEGMGTGRSDIGREQQRSRREDPPSYIEEP